MALDTNMLIVTNVANMPKVLEAKDDQLCRQKMTTLKSETQHGKKWAKCETGKNEENGKNEKNGKMDAIENLLRVSHSLYLIVTLYLCHCLLLPSIVSVCVCLRLTACA